jgi:Na+-transporting methylmalonyl-CoA/oxaloacetate decarboxylase gamma subunit
MGSRLRSSHLGHIEGEESYFVTMTDIMVGLLFIFLILLLFFAYRMSDQHSEVVPKSDYEQVQRERDDALRRAEELAAKNAQLQAELEQLRPIAGPLLRYFKQAAEVRSELLNRLRGMLTSQGFPVEINETQGLLRLQAGVLFESAKYDLPDPQNIQTSRQRITLDHLRALASSLQEVLYCRTLHEGLLDARQVGKCADSNVFVEAVLVEGHTDDQPILGGRADQVQSNHDLAGLRASRTLTALRAMAPQLGTYRSPALEPVIAASGYGEDRPVVPNDSDQSREKNRRIDIRILMYTPRSVEDLNHLEVQVRGRLAR